MQLTGMQAKWNQEAEPKCRSHEAEVERQKLQSIIEGRS